jgi:mannose/fructose/N-acetylgalactosamine-specific phosphotransferase system component IIC
MSPASSAATVALLGGALGLDTTAALQIMVSEPIVAGTLAGLALGDPSVGLALGAALQLVWSGALPVGAAPFPDSAPAAVGGVGGAVLLGGAGVPAPAALAAGFLAALVAGMVGQRVTAWLRGRNDRLAFAAETSAARGDARGVTAAVLLGLAGRFATAAAVALGTALALAALARPLSLLPSGREFDPVFWAAPIAACVGVIAARSRLERCCLAAGAAAGLAAGALL